VNHDRINQNQVILPRTTDRAYLKTATTAMKHLKKIELLIALDYTTYASQSNTHVISAVE